MEAFKMGQTGQYNSLSHSVQDIMRYSQVKDLINPFMHELRRPKSGFFYEVLLFVFKNDKEKLKKKIITTYFGI